MLAEIGEALGPAGTLARRQTILLEAFTSDPLLFIGFIQTKKKIVRVHNFDTGEDEEEEQLMKPGVYGGYRSNLTYLFQRYQYRPPPVYDANLKEYMEGVKRIANKARAAGQVSILHLYCNLFIISTNLCIHITGQCHVGLWE